VPTSKEVGEKCEGTIETLGAPVSDAFSQRAGRRDLVRTGGVEGVSGGGGRPGLSARKTKWPEEGANVLSKKFSEATEEEKRGRKVEKVSAR